MAEDNTTALAAMNSLYYSKSEYLCGPMLNMHSQLRTGQVLAFYENTLTQPADFPSRREWESMLRDRTSGNSATKRVAEQECVACVQKCQDCLERLREQVERMMESRERGASGRKRGRE